jgi:hypothetical protein
MTSTWKYFGLRRQSRRAGATPLWKQVGGWSYPSKALSPLRSASAVQKLSPETTPIFLGLKF